MDPKGFDNLTRRLARPASRRTALPALAGGVAAALAALRGGVTEVADVTAGANCRGLGERCDRDGACCSERCARGVCDCRRRGATCKVDRTCCSGRCRPNQRCA